LGYDKCLEKDLVIEINIVLTCTFDDIVFHPTFMSHWPIPLVMRGKSHAASYPPAKVTSRNCNLSEFGASLILPYDVKYLACCRVIQLWFHELVNDAIFVTSPFVHKAVLCIFGPCGILQVKVHSELGKMRKLGQCLEHRIGPFIGASVYI
jgi:hypothetical protein